MTVELPEDSHDEVEVFIKWLYTGSFSVHTTQTTDTSVSAYAFGMKVGSDEYCNAIMDALLDYHKECERQVNMNGLRLRYEAGLRSTPMGQFAMKSSVRYSMTVEDNDVLSGLIKQLNDTRITPEMVADVLAEVLEYRKSPWTNPVMWEKSHFHVTPEAA